MQPGDIVPLSFRPGLLALSFILSALGAYVALYAAARFKSEDGSIRYGSVAVAAISLGGIGIWGMHFIGMDAQRIPFLVQYRIVPTVVSLLIAIFASFVALWYVGRGTFSIANCVLGGVIAGLGVSAMHHVGMGATHMQAEFAWNMRGVLISTMIAILAATVALWLAFNLEGESQRVGASLIMAAAVCGMHYTSVVLSPLVCIVPPAPSAATFAGWKLPYLVFTVSVIALVVMRWQLARATRASQLRIEERMGALLEARSGDHGEYRGNA